MSYISLKSKSCWLVSRTWDTWVSCASFVESSPAMIGLFIFHAIWLHSCLRDKTSSVLSQHNQFKSTTFINPFITPITILAAMRYIKSRKYVLFPSMYYSCKQKPFLHKHGENNMRQPCLYNACVCACARVRACVCVLVGEWVCVYMYNFSGGRNAMW